MLTYPTVADEWATLRQVCAGKSIARYGDGEFNLVQGGKCVPQLFSKEIQQELRTILVNPHPECLVGVPRVFKGMPESKRGSWEPRLPQYATYLSPKVDYYSAFITRPDSAPHIAVKEYFDLMESLWSGQEVVLVYGGYRSLYPEFLKYTGATKVHPVLCSYEDTYNQIDYLEHAVMSLGVERVLLCAGPAATCLANRLSAGGLHAIDLGHIGLFWRQGDPAYQKLRFLPSVVTPDSSMTKAAIKAKGQASFHAPVNRWWPEVSKPNAETLLAVEQLHAEMLALTLPSKQQGACVLVGGGSGVIADMLAERYERVYVFQPDLAYFGSMRRNVKHKNILIYKEALGSRVGHTVHDGYTVLQVTVESLHIPDLKAIIMPAGYDEQVIAGAGGNQCLARRVWL